MVARSKQSSGKKRGSRRSTDAPRDSDGARARQRNVGPKHISRRTIVIAVGIVAAIVVASGLTFQFLSGGSPAVAAATFVGSETCGGCHRAEAELWRASQHRLAMQRATDKTVLGDFDDASFDYYGVHSRFFRRDGKFLVETDGPDGKLATFEVKYTFGIDPLHQYLVEFPDGRLQPLPLAWESHCPAMSSNAFFRLAVANTRTCLPCAAAGRTSRLSCKRVGKTRILMPVWDSSGESRTNGVMEAADERGRLQRQHAKIS